jgi:FkbM family methyltransferase
VGYPTVTRSPLHGRLKFLVRPNTDDDNATIADPTDHLLHVLPGQVAVDIGAHVGGRTLRLLEAGAEVIAIEPGIDQCQHLIRNLEHNGYNAPQVIVLNVAAWDGPETLHLEEPLAWEGGDRRVTGRTRTLSYGKGPTVKAYRLDAILAPLQVKIRVIKIDVQGAEGKVLRGAERTLLVDRPDLVIELHDRELNNPSIRTDVEDYLRSLGYKTRIAYRGPTNDFLTAKHQSNPELNGYVHMERLSMTWFRLRHVLIPKLATLPWRLKQRLVKH